MVEAATMEATRVPEPFIVEICEEEEKKRRDRTEHRNGSGFRGGRNPTELFAGSRPEKLFSFLS